MSPKKTRIVDRVLHWLSAGAIIFLLFDMGTRIHSIDYRVKGAIQHKQDAIELHVAIAFVLFVTLVGRMVWYRFFLDQAYHLKYESNKHKCLVRTVHLGMYLTLFLFMISGLFMVTNYEHSLNIFGFISLSEANADKLIFNSANNWHLYFESSIYLLIFAHFIGAMYNRR